MAKNFGYFTETEDNPRVRLFPRESLAEGMAQAFDARKVIRETGSGCWIWMGGRNKGGYAEARIDGKMRYLHRVIYELAYGPIPIGMTIDHLCRERACINPDHLEAVTNKENILRGESVSARNARKTHCKNGHSLLGRNIYAGRDGRICIRCNRETARLWRVTKREAR